MSLVVIFTAYATAVTIHPTFCRHSADLIESPHVLDVQSMLCLTSASEDQTAPISDASHQFHLAWECHELPCNLPSLYIHTLSTIRAYHPHATINLYSATIKPGALQTQLTNFPQLQVNVKSLPPIDSLPDPAQNGFTDIPSFFKINPNSHSHFSDLLRLSILYLYGGVWLDLDSLMLAPIDKLGDGEWVPKTQGSTTWSQTWYIEGGWMNLEQNSPFAKTALQNFPKYDAETANCWACVGPKLLTNTYLQMQKDNKSVPRLIDSQQAFGTREYRENLDVLHSDFQMNVIENLISHDVIGVHLFTSSKDRPIRKQSTIDVLFALAGVELSTELIVPLGPLSRRRLFYENSLGYDDTLLVRAFRDRVTSSQDLEMESVYQRYSSSTGASPTEYRYYYFNCSAPVRYKEAAIRGSFLESQAPLILSSGFRLSSDESVYVEVVDEAIYISFHAATFEQIRVLFLNISPDLVRHHLEENFGDIYAFGAVLKDATHSAGIDMMWISSAVHSLDLTDPTRDTQQRGWNVQYFGLIEAETVVITVQEEDSKEDTMVMVMGILLAIVFCVAIGIFYWVFCSPKNHDFDQPGFVKRTPGVYLNPGEEEFFDTGSKMSMVSQERSRLPQKSQPNEYFPGGHRAESATMEFAMNGPINSSSKKVEMQHYLAPSTMQDAGAEYAASEDSYFSDDHSYV